MTINTMLFVPGHRPDRFASAIAAGSDAVCIDLEDAVPASDKLSARTAALAFIAQTENFIGLRINPVDTREGLEDLVDLARSNCSPDFLLVPKAESPDIISLIKANINKNVDIIPLIETPIGIERASDLAITNNVKAIMFGGGDYARIIGAEFEWASLLYPRSVIVAAAGRAGIEAIDVPFIDLTDDAGLLEESSKVRRLGFTGKAAIHPKQVETIERAWMPTESEIATAKRVLAAYNQAGGNVFLFEGKMLDAPLIRHFEKVLARARSK